MSLISENLDKIKTRIFEAEKRSPYNQKTVLVAVSKTKPAADIKEAYDLGIRDFGENKVQELIDKYDKLPDDIRWHMIGHLQTNKIKYIIDKVCLIHSVDSLHLAEAINKEAEKRSLVSHVLLQINVSGEESKFGVSFADAISFYKAVSVLKNIKVHGLMTIAPYSENPESNRVYFRLLKKLSIDIGRLNNDNNEVCDLSMGMTGDFETAIEEGSKYVRVGTGIFGERDYNIF